MSDMDSMEDFEEERFVWYDLECEDDEDLCFWEFEWVVEEDEWRLKGGLQG